jgi:transcriptional regulator with XRE-family HTH domain
MAIAAHFDADETRPRGARRVLRLTIRGETEAGAAASVLVHNISATGLLLETAARLAVGERITIELPQAGAAEASVVWDSGRFYGCQLAAPLSPAALDAAQLRSAVDGLDGASPTDAAPDEGFPARLQRLRKRRGLTLAQIALVLGVSKPTVWAWEQGRARPVESRIDALANVLGVSRAELLPAVHDGDGLRDLLAQARERIAAAAGASPDRIRILIEL